MWLFLVGLAAAALSDDLAIAADIAQPTEIRQAAYGALSAYEPVSELVAIARSDNTPNSIRWVAVRALGPHPSSAARDALIVLLDDVDPQVRMATVGAIGDRRDRSMSGLVALKLTDKATLVRAAAAASLGVLKDPATLADLSRALADPTNFYRGSSLWVRRNFVEAMVAIGGRPAAPYLAKALDDKDPAVAAAALLGLETIAGFTFKEGRTAAEEREAWRRWAR